jgi:hypothetical protein
MPINTEARDDSHCHQVFAVKQLGMDVCSIYISEGGEAIKKMRRKRERMSSCLHFYDFFFFFFFFLIVLKAIKNGSNSLPLMPLIVYSSVTC